MKKIFCLFVLLLVCASSASASHRVGMLERLNVTPEEFSKIVDNSEHVVMMRNNPEKPTFSFYKSITQMIMALNAGEIDEMLLPEETADYFLNLHPEYLINCVVITRKSPFLLSFGFKADNKELADSFNKALAEMKRDGTLITLQGKYILGSNTAMMEETAITDPNAKTPDPVVFRKFDGAKEINAAVTGDMPPIDYIAPDGSAEGFNAAMLAEICGRLGLNVKLQNIESGARAAMLSSGRSDVVFWFEHRRGSSALLDVPEGVILSEPYYEFDTFYHIKKAAD